MKLYKNISRFKVRRNVSRSTEKRIKWALSLKPGDLINDCSAFNVVIREINPDIHYINNGWYIYGVMFKTEPFGGSCSLNHCGVELPKPRDVLEKDYMDYMSESMMGDGPGTMAYWCGGRDSKDFKITEKNYLAKLEVIKSGGHFLDERGVLMDEFRK